MLFFFHFRDIIRKCQKLVRWIPSGQNEFDLRLIARQHFHQCTLIK